MSNNIDDNPDLQLFVRHMRDALAYIRRAMQSQAVDTYGLGITIHVGKHGDFHGLMASFAAAGMAVAMVDDDNDPEPVGFVKINGSPVIIKCGEFK